MLFIGGVADGFYVPYSIALELRPTVQVNVADHSDNPQLRKNPGVNYDIHDRVNYDIHDRVKSPTPGDPHLYRVNVFQFYRLVHFKDGVMHYVFQGMSDAEAAQLMEERLFFQ